MSSNPIGRRTGRAAMRWKQANWSLRTDFDGGHDAEIAAHLRGWSPMRRDTWSDEGFGD